MLWFPHTVINCCCFVEISFRWLLNVFYYRYQFKCFKWHSFTFLKPLHFITIISSYFDWLIKVNNSVCMCVYLFSRFHFIHTVGWTTRSSVFFYFFTFRSPPSGFYDRMITSAIKLFATWFNSLRLRHFHFARRWSINLFNKKKAFFVQ